jgi:hypothetical protein
VPVCGPAARRCSSHSFLGWLPFASVAAAATPIPNDPPNGPRSFQLHRRRRTAKPVKAPRVSQNPFMASNGLNNVQRRYVSDTYTWSGPLSRSPTVNSQFFGTLGSCGITITFDRLGRLITTCTSATTQELRMFDPTTLDTLADFDLPPQVIPPRGKPFTSKWRPTSSSTIGTGPRSPRAARSGCSP